MLLMKSQRTFYLALANRFGAAVAVFIAGALAVAWPHAQLMVAFAVQTALFLVILLGVCTVSVNPEGLTLNRLNKASWADITSVKQTTFLGLPYLLVHRHQGWRWWLPLYLRDPRGFIVALRESAPAGNPVRTYAESQSNI